MAIKFGRPIESRTRFTPVETNPAGKDEQLDLTVRMRRNRRSEWARRMVRENVLTTDDLIWPLFVMDGTKARTPVQSMPDVERLSVDEVAREAVRAAQLSIPCIALFPYTDPKLRDETGSEALNPDNLVCRAIRAIKKEVPEIGVLCDVALDPFTSHGHDGLLRDGVILNDETVAVLVKQALLQAEMGCDIIAPSDMMDGRVAAILSAAGAVGGSALANDAEQAQADLLRHWPGAKCDEGDGGGVKSLRPDVRMAWMAQNPLPPGLGYYSLVTLPTPDRISRVIEKSYRKLGEIDWRNDSQVIYSDQIIPGSTLLGFLNCDHWAIAVPVSRSHPVISRSLVDKNDYPREALLEAVLRFIEEDLNDGQLR